MPQLTSFNEDAPLVGDLLDSDLSWQNLCGAPDCTFQEFIEEPPPLSIYSPLAQGFSKCILENDLRTLRDQQMRVSPRSDLSSQDQLANRTSQEMVSGNSARKNLLVPKSFHRQATSISCLPPSLWLTDHSPCTKHWILRQINILRSQIRG
jgi:hypothetical protein